MPKEVWFLKFEESVIGRFKADRDNHLSYVSTHSKAELSTKIKYPLVMYPRNIVRRLEELEMYEPTALDLRNWLLGRVFPAERSNSHAILNNINVESYDPWEIAKTTRATSPDDYFWISNNQRESFREIHPRSRIETSNATVKGSEQVKTVYDSIMEVTISIAKTTGAFAEVLGKTSVAAAEVFGQASHIAGITSVRAVESAVNVQMDVINKVLGRASAVSKYLEGQERLRSFMENQEKMKSLAEQANKAATVEQVLRKSGVFRSFEKTSSQRIAERLAVNPVEKLINNQLRHVTKMLPSIGDNAPVVVKVVAPRPKSRRRKLKGTRQEWLNKSNRYVIRAHASEKRDSED